MHVAADPTLTRPGFRFPWNLSWPIPKLTPRLSLVNSSALCCLTRPLLHLKTLRLAGRLFPFLYPPHPPFSYLPPAVTPFTSVVQTRTTMMLSLIRFSAAAVFVSLSSVTAATPPLLPREGEPSTLTIPLLKRAPRTLAVDDDGGWAAELGRKLMSKYNPGKTLSRRGQGYNLLTNQVCESSTGAY